MIVDHDFLGVGPRNFSAVYLASYDDARFNAHNLYLHLAAELGVLGLLAFLAAVAAWLVRVARAYLAAADEGDRLLLLGLTGSVAALLMHGLVEAVWAWEPLAELVWLLLALGLAAVPWAEGPLEPCEHAVEGYDRGVRAATESPHAVKDAGGPATRERSPDLSG
jgi:O-antigen ligase